MKQEFELDIDFHQLNKQIKDLLDSNIQESSKAGLHNLLGEIKDQKIEIPEATKEEGIIAELKKLNETMTEISKGVGR
ncbi:MAG: hypothetical protein GY861_17210 [bacterium]|nr:hypothetical protein [bacterium]